MVADWAAVIEQLNEAKHTSHAEQEPQFRLSTSKFYVRHRTYSINSLFHNPCRF